MLVFALFLNSALAGNLTLDRVDHGDGSYSLKDDGSIKVGATVWEGPILWQFTGMSEYSWDPVYWPKSIPYEIVGGDSPSEVEKVLGSVKFDGSGRRWEAIDVDESELPIADFSAAQYSVIEPEIGEWSPQSWDSSNTCGTPAAAVNLWDGEDRSVFSTISANRHYRIVTINTSVGNCTGVQVGPTDVLTNGHCTTNFLTTGHPEQVATVNYICSRGNTYSGADCVWEPSGGFTVTIGPDWSGGATNPSNDFALVEWTNGTIDLNRLDGIATSGMPISTMTDGEIEAQDVAMYGHPRWRFTTSCLDNLDTTPIDSSLSKFVGYGLAFDWRNDQTVSSTRIKTNTDCSGGQSGGAYFACPDNPDCSLGEELVGLHSAYVNTGIDKYCGGPKAGQFASFVSSNL